MNHFKLRAPISGAHSSASCFVFPCATMPSTSPPKYDYIPVSDHEQKVTRVWPSRESHSQFAWSKWIFLLLLAGSSFLIGGLLGFGAGEASMLDVSYDVPCTLQQSFQLMADSGMILIPHLLRKWSHFPSLSNRIELSCNVPRTSQTPSGALSTQETTAFSIIPIRIPVDPPLQDFISCTALYVARLFFHLAFSILPHFSSRLKTSLLTHSLRRTKRTPYAAASTNSGMRSQPWKTARTQPTCQQRRSR